MKRENKLKQQTDTNRCLTGRATVDSAWKTSKTMLPPWRASGHPGQKTSRNPAEQQKSSSFVSQLETGKEYCLLCHKWRSLTLLEPLSAGNIFWQPRSLLSGPSEGLAKRSGNKQTGNTQRHFTGSQQNWGSAALQAIKENTHDPTRGWWKISAA